MPRKKSKPRSTKGDPARNDPTIAVNIRRFRTAAGISQTALGDAVGVTFQQIQKYEKGANACPPGRLRQICGILGITPAEMFGAPPEVKGVPVPLSTQRAHKTLVALESIQNDAVQRIIERLIDELAEVFGV